MRHPRQHHCNGLNATFWPRAEEGLELCSMPTHDVRAHATSVVPMSRDLWHYHRWRHPNTVTGLAGDAPTCFVRCASLKDCHRLRAPAWVFEARPGVVTRGFRVMEVWKQ